MILIQPQRANLRGYEDFAVKEQLGFEITDLSDPTILDDPRLSEFASRYPKERAVSLYGAYLDLNIGSPDSLIRAASQNRYRQSCQLAQEMGLEHVVFRPGVPQHDGEADWIRHSVTLFEQLLSAFPVRIYIENAPGLSPDLLLRLMEKAGTPRLQVCLNVGHLSLSSVRPEEWFEKLQPYIGYLRLSDRNSPSGCPLPIGEGSVDWKIIDRICHVLHFDWEDSECIVTVDSRSLPELEQSVQFLRKNLYFPFRV